MSASVVIASFTTGDPCHPRVRADEHSRAPWEARAMASQTLTATGPQPNAHWEVVLWVIARHV